MRDLVLEDTNEESKTIVADIALPTINLVEDAQTVSDLLSFIDPGAKLHLLPDTVEPLLRFADMIGFDKLQTACAQYLAGRVSWDPVATLRLAEEYRFAELYSAAGNAVLQRYDAFSPLHSLDLSEKTIEKVSDTVCLSMRAQC